MGLRQFANSVRLILGNSHISRDQALGRHMIWQSKKLLNLFPFEQSISHSAIIASHRRCGVSALIYSQGLYDYNNMQLIQHLLKSGGTFVDIGGNIGSYALIASEQKLAKVHVFEPHPVTFRLLRQNIELNQRSNVTLHNVALGSSEREVFLTDRSGSSINHIVPGIRQPTGTIAVPCHRMDKLCQTAEITPQIVKIDVEGFEYDVLLGFGDYLSSVQVLMIEMNGLSDARSHGQQEIHSLLTSAGLTGPWQCKFDECQLLPLRCRSREDSLYISASFCQQAPSIGLTFVEST
jgi:FkbM family methyltransferase